MNGARILGAILAVSLVTLLAAATQRPTGDAPRGAREELDADEIGFMGNAGHVLDSKNPKLTAYFTQESYRPGDKARLIVTDDASRVEVQFFRAGGERVETVDRDVMRGSPASSITHLGAVHGRLATLLHIGSWPSGVYFARLSAPGGRLGYAPFVLAPRTLGEHRIAVVMPTQTWQAYNFRDDDGDGHPDTWYAGWKTNKARLVRAFLNRGVPPHWKQYDAPFVRWLVQTHRDVDYLSDADLRAVRSGDELAHAYTLIVFSGHHEYVTSHEYDVVVRYRDLGGNLAFLAANNFFWKITIKNHVMARVAQWRDLGRPEAALIGVQYRGNDEGRRRGPWIIRSGCSDAHWLLEHMRVTSGDGVGRGGIEIDSTSSASPKNVRVLAEIPNLFGPSFTAQMTYYETREGARVFAAGAFSLAGSVWKPGVGALMTNLWERLGTN